MRSSTPWLLCLFVMGGVNGFFLRMSDSSFRSERRLFQTFLDTYQKPYTASTSEGEKRFQHFCTNVDHIRNHNHQSKSYKLDINQFADESLFQLQRNLLVCQFPTLHASGLTSTPTLSSPPSHVDWTKQEKVSRVKNQGSCGSCWAFSTVGALESRLRIKYNTTVDLSEQQLVDCSSSNHGCQGGLMSKAIQDIRLMGGLMAEKDYPYVAKKNGCRIDYTKKVAYTDNMDYRFVRPMDAQELKQQLHSNGPLCSAVEVDPLHFLFYKEGIYDLQKKNHQLNPAVLLTAYQENAETPFWTIKNSWGTSWGEQGYMRMAMTDTGSEGVAGLYLYNIYLC